MHKLSKHIPVNHPILTKWDTSDINELREKERYLYVLAVVLSEALQKDRSPKIYDYKVVYDLLSDDHPASYDEVVLQSVLDDLKNFTDYWVDTKDFYADKNEFLLGVFANCLDRFFVMKDFDRLKTHRLKERIHRPILAVLSLRVKQWLQDMGTNDYSTDLLVTLD